MAAKQLVLVAACATIMSASAKIFVFKANQCNTNFNDPSNWANLNGDGATADHTTTPAVVDFGDVDGHFNSIDVNVPAGEYSMGELDFQDDMVMHFADDGAVMEFQEDIEFGAPARFVAGQSTMKGECSLGCHSNFYEYLGRDEEEAAKAQLTGDKKSDRLVETEVTPCGKDTVVVPEGYNVNFLAMGFHAFRSIVYPSGGRLKTAQTVGEMAEYSLFPSNNQRLVLGNLVVDQCMAEGMINDNDECVCASECPATENAALADANEIRASAKSHANEQLTEFERGRTMKVQYTYSGAFGADDGIKNPGCNFRETTLNKNLNKYYAKNVVIKGTSVDVDAEGQSVTIAATVTGTNGILNGQAATFSSPILIRPMAGVDAIDVKSNVEAIFAMGLYANILETLGDDCNLSGQYKNALLIAAGVSEEEERTDTIYVGQNLPQFDVNRLVDSNNKDGVVKAVFEAIKDAQAWDDLNVEVILENWELATSEEIHKDRRDAHTNDAGEAGEASKDTRYTDTRMGIATSLIKVKLEYMARSTGFGLNKPAVQDIINWVLATYNTKTHHKCFTFNAGFDNACITDIVAKIISKELLVCAATDKGSVAKCADSAFKLSKTKIVQIKGCGLHGSQGEGAKETCIDKVAETRANREADATAKAAVAQAVKLIENEHAGDLKAIFDAEVLLNQTNAGYRAKQAEEIERAVSKATVKAGQTALAAAGNEKTLKRLFQDSDELTTLAKGKYDEAMAAYSTCMKALAKAGGVGSCDKEREAYFLAERIYRSSMQATATYKLALDNAGLSQEDLDAQLAAAKAAAAGQTKLVADKLAAANAAGCDPKAADISAVCQKLLAELEAARKELTDLNKKVAEAEAAAAAAAVLKNSTPAEEKDSGGGILVIAGAIGGVIILCLIVVVVVLFKSEPASLRDKQRANEVVAFANPMYDDPSSGGIYDPSAQGMYDDPSAQGAVYNETAGATKQNPIGEDMYDEPTFNDDNNDEPTFNDDNNDESEDKSEDEGGFEDEGNNDATGEVEGGYLDVEPDDEDEEDEEDEDSDEDESESESD